MSCYLSLPAQNFEECSELLRALEKGDFYHVLTSSNVSRFDRDPHSAQIIRLIFGEADVERPPPSRDELLLVGIAALHAFLQSNVTGPPLKWSSADLLQSLKTPPRESSKIRRDLLEGLTVDGAAVYPLTPHVELFVLAKLLLNSPFIVQDGLVGHVRWARMRVNFWHQQILSEIAATLQQEIYRDLDYLEGCVLGLESGCDEESKTRFLLEKVAIHTYHGFDARARDDLKSAAKVTGFEYVLTGRLGKRTKFQENDLSQLVVLAKSADTKGGDQITNDGDILQPENLELNDDTLLESIAFAKSPANPEISPADHVPPSLQNLDPANQPLLKPLDSIILLALASSITNTSPQHGLTREETMPYATRVLDGGSSNWQIYTQSLLVRSRIEGYKSRTVERGVLQLQALVDQVIAETTPSKALDSSNPSITISDDYDDKGPSTFLPRPKPSESAPATERLQYIHQLASPPRWTLEAELASRWISLGSVRTALEIYERLQMWAEVALCWAAIDREDNARKTIRQQLYLPTPSTPHSATDTDPLSNETDEQYLGQEQIPLPPDAPRLFCILGDLDKSPPLYERAWTVSNNRYARAQRSLGKYHLAERNHLQAAEAYSKSLTITPLHHCTWFALGCVRLELREWSRAVEAFSRAVLIEADDAESWSNLAAALLRLAPSDSAPAPVLLDDDDDDNDNIVNEGDDRPRHDTAKHVREAFPALKRAAALKRDSYRIWQNLLNVAATLRPLPAADLIIAQQRVIELRGDVEGESCVDVEAMEGLLAHLIASAPPPHPASRPSLPPNTTTTPSTPPSPFPSPSPRHRHPPGLETMLTALVEKHITPLITHSRRLWQLVARLSLHLRRPAAALEAYEKAWRVALLRPGWEDGGGMMMTKGGREAWREVVGATGELVRAYEGLGGMGREDGDGGGGREGEGEGEGKGKGKGKGKGEGEGEGEVVCARWRYKARMAIGSVKGRRGGVGMEMGGGGGGREGKGDDGWEALERKGEELRGKGRKEEGREG